MPTDPQAKSMLVLLAGEARHDARVLRHVRCFLEAGLSVTLLSCDPVSPLQDEPRCHHIRWPGYGQVKQHARAWKAKKGYLFYFLKLCSMVYFNWLAWRTLRHVRFDGYLANDFDTLPAASRLVARSGGKLIYDSHELFAEQRPDTPRLYIWAVRFCEGTMLRLADQIVTVNPSIAEELRRRHRLRTLPEVIFNVPVHKARRAPTRLPGSVLFHGNLMRGRGLEQLVTAVARMPQAHLRLRGHGELEVVLRQLAEQLGARERIAFEPPVPVQQVICAAARFEIGVVFLESDCLNNRLGLPNKIFEYMHAGLAVLTNSAPELQRIVAEHDIGMALPDITPEAIEAALRQLLAHEPRRTQCQANALSAAQSTYHFGLEQAKWQRIVQRLWPELNTTAVPTVVEP
jgi:glycosyltransferase involved in cell wall biosynthesis